MPNGSNGTGAGPTGGETGRSPSAHFGRMAVREGLVTEADVRRCQAVRRQIADSGRVAPSLDRVLVEQGYLGAADAERLLAMPLPEEKPRGIEGYDLGDTYPGTFEGGVIDVYLVDQAGRDAFLAGGAFDAYAVHLAAEEGSAEVTIPSGEDWYVVLDNGLWPVSTKFVSVQITSGS